MIYIRKYILDEDQIEFLIDLMNGDEDTGTEWGEASITYNAIGSGAVMHETRQAGHKILPYVLVPDVSFELKQLALELNPSTPDEIQFTELEFLHYEIGGKFTPHVDANYGDGSARLFTCVTMLDKDPNLVGGDLVIYEGDVDSEKSIVRLDLGETVLFPAGVLHECTPIEQGYRKVLISWAHVRES